MKEIDLGRRRLLGLAASLGASAVFGKLVSACSDDPVSAEAADATTTATTDDAAAATTVADAATEAATDAAAIPWATGGTAAMTAKATYPNPFDGVAAPTTCTASCALTEGPCYSSQSVEIQDISYGYSGLPMRLYLQILDESCKPVSGATVDLWHVAPNGEYSGNDAVNENIAFCTANDPNFTSKLYFRGKQTTDANGIVYFDSCFPGWYSSRTIHIHMTISIGTTAYVTTQFGFDDTLDDEIVGSQPLYDTRGSRDTKNTTDTVLPAAPDLSNYLFQTSKMSDGAMLAWKQIILRSNLSETLCSPAGAGGGGGGPGGGMGGPPGDGGMMPPPDGGFDGGPPPDAGQ